MPLSQFPAMQSHSASSRLEGSPSPWLEGSPSPWLEGSPSAAAPGEGSPLDAKETLLETTRFRLYRAVRAGGLTAEEAQAIFDGLYARIDKILDGTLRSRASAEATARVATPPPRLRLVARPPLDS